MPRVKKQAPARLSGSQIQAQTWNMNDRQEPGPSGMILDDDDDDNIVEIDREDVPRDLMKENDATVPNLNEELDKILDCSKFYASVSLNPESARKSPTEWLETLADFAFSAEKGSQLPLDKVQDENEFWIYFSEVPGMTSAYFQWFFRRTKESSRQYFERKKRGKDPDGYQVVQLKTFPSSEVMECFASNIGPKRRCFSMMLKEFDQVEGQGMLSVIVTESSLFKPNHHSDVIPGIPRCIINTLNGIFRQDESSVNLTEIDNFNEFKPDIDELYEIVKRYHEQELDNYCSSGIDPQHSSLIPKLRPYQRNAIRWMISQETNDNKTSGKIHPLYKEVRTLEGTTLYFNYFGGYLVKSKPLAIIKPPGGILADEMGLGKTVEILSLMLCHHRKDLTDPAYQESIVLRPKSKKTLRRRRSPSPVEFLLNHAAEQDAEKPEEAEMKGEKLNAEEEVKDEPELEDKENNILLQLDGNNDFSDSEEEDTSDEEYIPRPSKSRRSQNPNESPSSTESESESEEPSPPKKRRVHFKEGLEESGRKKQTMKNAIFNPKKDKPPPKSVLKKSERFDPSKILQGRKVSAKSPMADQILEAIIKIDKFDGVSAQSIKKYLVDQFQKTHKHVQQHFKKNLLKLTESGRLINTSHASGASGSFIINPDFENFDSRGIYCNQELDEIGTVIERVITHFCYNGKPFDKKDAERKANVHKKEKKAPGAYQRLKTIYESSLAEMSEVCELTPEYKKARKRWNGTFFDTKVGQSEFFECICGSDLHSDDDDKYRVQCCKCQLWQHSECVKFDVSNPYRGDYICPHCWTFEKPVPSGATLIISPTSISYQWIEEIQKHIKHKNVRMLFYKGTKQSGYIQPRDLAKYDIVITTYSILQSETNYVDLPHSNSSEGRRFRNPKRFMAIPAPLPCIEWWRICLDEAQMIESTTTKTAEMALRLSAVNRWCVTGTPIEKSLNDIQGLLLFLKLDPYSLPFWWRYCLYGPYCKGSKSRLESVLCDVMWRTCKKDVLNQINIPKQTIEMHWLSFSPVEEHFYRTQHIECSREAVAKIARCPNLDVRLSELDRNSLNLLLNPLLRLRQSCCHPQAVRGQFMNLQKQNTMTMEQLLDEMIKKVTVECEESHRQIIAALNGMAGVDIIEENWTQAVEKYREVLRTVEEYKDRIKTDTLQKLHTVTNLAELLEAGHENVAPTLRDGSLRDEAKELQKKYLSKYSTALEAAKGALKPLREKVEEHKNEFLCDNEAWYVTIINSVGESIASEDTLMKLVRDEMAQFFDVVNDREFRQIEQKYSSSRIVLYKVSEKVSEFDSMRDKISKDITFLESSPPEKFLNGAVDCHLRISAINKKNKETCKLCQVHDNIEVYESMIFHFVKDEVQGLKKNKARATITSDEYQNLEEKGVILFEEQRKGTWGDSEAERLLKAILKFAKLRQSDYSSEVLNDGSIHLRLIEAMKKEFKSLRILWRQIFDHVAGVDELNMSIMRLRLRFEDEPATSQSELKRKKTNVNLATREANKLETIYILEVHELPSQKLKLSSEKTIANGEFRKKFGQLLYLENLKKSDFHKTEGSSNPEPCPICQQSLGRQWSVLQCGHCFCVECIGVLMKEYSSFGNKGRSVKCPVCRNCTNHTEISYVNTEAEENKSDLDANEPVKGSLSTKMKAVVKTLIKIRADDPTAKSLVFSTWHDVLDIVGSALVENDISFAALHTQGKFKRNLQKFKNREDVKVLLMPITSGANGLNLVEASHVILIEPILNPAQELQAIGRVHRIGQNKPTTVHKFVIRSTIEERMNKILSSFQTEECEQGSHSTEENLLTLRDLKHIFVEAEEANVDG